MNPRQVFVSVLLFGVAGLLLFMYLQAWIEEQHTESGKKLQQETINQHQEKHTGTKLKKNSNQKERRKHRVYFPQ